MNVRYLLLGGIVLLSCKKQAGPTADFSYTGTLQNFTPLQFNNLSSGAQTYSWDFGDGTATSSDQSPSHTFRRAGTYQVALTAAGDGGATTKKQVLTLAQADTVSAIIATVTGNYLFTKRLFNCYGAGCAGPYAEPCNVTMTVSRAGNNVQIEAITPTLPLINSNQYYQFFTLTGVSAANRLEARFKRDTDSLVFTRGSGGSGGGNSWTYYGKRVR